mgnify:CR=1 FL=1
MAQIAVDGLGNVTTDENSMILTSGGLPLITVVATGEHSGHAYVEISTSVFIDPVIPPDSYFCIILVNKSTGIEYEHHGQTWKGEFGSCAVATTSIGDSWVRLVNFADHSEIFAEGTVAGFSI